MTAIPGLGVIPDHWASERARWLLHRQRRDVRPEDGIVTAFRDGQVTLRERRRTEGFTNAIQEIGYQGIRIGDLVVHGMDGFAGAIGVSDSDGKSSPVVHAYRANEKAEARYFAYALRTLAVNGYVSTLAKGIRERSTAFDASTLANVLLPVPPLEEQRRIADFLDAETARIDALTNARDAQLSILGERELSIIGHMLSGGATSQEGRATGWPWLPYVPAGWSIGPVYAYYSAELGKMLNPERASGESLRPYLRNANIHWYEIDTLDMASMHFEAGEVRRYSVAAGDLLVCEGGAGIAEAAVWDGRIEECYFQKSLHRVRQVGAVPVEWLMYWLRFAKASGVFDAGGNLATIPHLTGEQLRQYRIPIPLDGKALVRETGRSIDDMAKARALLNRAKTKLSERRQALITAAVTGQFDVSTASGRNVTDGVSA